MAGRVSMFFACLREDWLLKYCPNEEALRDESCAIMGLRMGHTRGVSMQMHTCM